MTAIEVLEKLKISLNARIVAAASDARVAMCGHNEPLACAIGYRIAEMHDLMEEILTIKRSLTENEQR